ncbi:MAG TPA: DUF418 domain-containing protein [Dehalococcoidia bacterium]|nr:DUF418 domain-containing protein [Dehalococcoidia bacterium]
MSGERAGPAPVAESERIGSLDVLRGFAVLSILVMNIQSFSMPFSAYINPTVYGDLTGANRWVWVLSHVLADQKFMTIFSMLFGAGIALLTSRVETRGSSAGRVHYRRILWLLFFGLLHAYLLWYGDILVLYAVCGLVAYAFRKLQPSRLLLVGALVIALPSAFYLFSGWSMPYWPQEGVAQLERDTWNPPPEEIAREVATYRGGWWGQMEHRAPAALEFQTFLTLIWGFWRAGGLMLVGMGLFKLGVFSAQRSAGFYLGLVAAAVLVGIPVVSYGVRRNFAANWDIHYSFFLGSQYNYWGSIVVSLGYVGLVMLACRKPALGWLTRPFAAVGRMAFTNYLLQTLICTTIFYGHGLGLFGEVERVGQIAVVAGVWAAELILSPLWLRYFQMGPFEWLWRSLTYGRWQPFRRPVAR